MCCGSSAAVNRRRRFFFVVVNEAQLSQLRNCARKHVKLTRVVGDAILHVAAGVDVAAVQVGSGPVQPGSDVTRSAGTAARAAETIAASDSKSAFTRHRFPLSHRPRMCLQRVKGNVSVRGQGRKRQCVPCVW